MARPKYTGFYTMCVSLKKQTVVKDLEKYPEIIKKLGRFHKEFIKWCAKQRLDYEHDIFDEVEEFIKQYIKKRLYNFNIKLWKEISQEIFERDNYTCKYCNNKGGLLEIDHRIPISKGGSNELSNLLTSCQRCNRQKRNKTIGEFKAWRESYVS